MTGGPAGTGARASGSTGRRRRALGQHFLADPGVAARIVEAVGATAADVVCEIGAGPGALTRALATRAGRLVALEVDPALQARLVAAARHWPEAGRVEIRLVDAREFAYEELRALRPAPEGRVLVVGNLPYSVSKAILARLLDAHATLDAAVLMLQREVAERMPRRREGATTARSRCSGSSGRRCRSSRWSRPRVPAAAGRRVGRDPRAVHAGAARAGVRRGGLRARGPGGLRPAAEDPGERAPRRGPGESVQPGGRAGQAGIDGGRRAETLALEEFVRLADALGRTGAITSG